MPLLSSDLACMGRVTCSESIGLVRRAGELTHVCLSHLRRKERGQSNGCFGGCLQHPRPIQGTEILHPESQASLHSDPALAPPLPE
jgi:hypothetical protein